MCPDVACRTRIFAVAWLLLCMAMLIGLVVMLPRVHVNSSVLALLPQESFARDGDGVGERQAMPEALQNVFLQRLDRQLVWMVSSGSDDTQDDMAPVLWWYAQLQNMQALKTVSGPMSTQEQAAWGHFAYTHRYSLLDEQTRTRLENNTQAEWVLAQVYSAFAGVSGVELSRDPLLLVRGAQMAQAGGLKSSLVLEQGWLVARDGSGKRWYFMYGELVDSSDTLNSNHTTVAQLQALEQQLQAQWPQAQVLSRGALFYSENASMQAQNDIKKLGTLTICGVLLLIFLVYRSPRPIVLCLLSVGSGALAGITATLLVFGEIHLMTLVLSISVVGVSTDYAIYYLTERMVHGQTDTPFASAQKIAATQWLALITTVLAYLIMWFAPFPGLRQLAVFAAAGLCAAGLTVMYGFPFLVRGLPVRAVPAMGLLLRWLHAWRSQKGVRWGVPLAFLLFSMYGLMQLKVDDDIAQLQSLPQHILQQEKRITELSGQSVDQKWFAVYGHSGEQALQRLEGLQLYLDVAKAQGLLTYARVLPLNSLQRQQRDRALLQEKQSAIVAQLQAVGVDVRAPDLSLTPMSPEEWMGSPVSQGWRLLWASLESGETAILVPVGGVSDSSALHKLAQQVPGVAWEDRKAIFDALFYHYRTMLGYLLLVAVALLTVSYVIRLGFKNGLISIVPSLLSLSSSLAALALSGQPLNLFALLALILVLGIGINYSLFFSNPKGTPTTSMLATVLAFFTTQMTFGVLLFSTTQAISSFGLVLSSGVFVAFILSPLALLPKRKMHKQRNIG